MTIQQQLGSMTIIPDATAIRLARYFEPLLRQGGNGPIKRFIHSGTIEEMLLFKVGMISGDSPTIISLTVVDTHPQAKRDQHAMMADLRALSAYLFAAGVRPAQGWWGQPRAGGDGVVPWCYGRPSATP